MDGAQGRRQKTRLNQVVSVWWDTRSSHWFSRVFARKVPLKRAAPSFG
jgi:hypothetical protein